MAWIRPSFMDNMSWAMSEVYGAITDQILINLAHYFPYWKPGESVPKSSFEYQANMLAQMGQVNKDTIRIIVQGMSGADGALKSVLEQAIMESVKKSNPELLKGVMSGMLTPAGVPAVAPSQMRAFQLYYQQAAEKLNLVNTVMLESTRQAYQATVADIANRVQVTQSALNIGAGETVTGVSTWNQAVRHSIDRMKDGGIVGFIDHGGHRWSAEAYVSMDIRTTVANTARAAVWETNQDFGNDLYIVSYHDGARPKCYPWQNKVISSLDNARTVKDLDGNDITVIAQSSTSYGAPDGLFGINCKHYPSPFIPGVSVLYDDSNIPGEKENAEVYEQTQEQRRLERKLREEKRDILMAKAQGATAEQLEPLRERARQTSADIDDFCDSTGLPRRRNREGVYTKREFPDPDTYDPATFERDQKDMIDRYFKTGGVQKDYSFGTMTPKGEITPPAPPATPVAPVPSAPVPIQATVPAPENVASKATQTQPKVDTTNSAQLDAKNFPDSFNKKKSKTFVDAVNATEGTDTNVVELFNTMGAQVNGQTYPVKISYTEDGHYVRTASRVYDGEVVKIDVKVPKMTDPDYLRQEIGTSAHEWGHLFDHINGEKDGVLSYTHDNGALPNALRNARPMSERVRKMVDDAVRDGKAASDLVYTTARAEINALNADISKAFNDRDFATYNELVKKRNALWKEAERTASKESRKAHNGVNAIEDIYDAISGGTLRDKTGGLYGHGSKYYKRNPGGENAATETFANYCSLALGYPDLFKLMAEEQPEVWEACGNIVKAMLGR